MHDPNSEATAPEPAPIAAPNPSPGAGPEAGDGDPSRMPLWEHLEDLRGGLIRSLIALGVGATVCYFFAQPILELLERPLLRVLPENERTLYFTGVADKFFIYLKTSVFAGAFVVSPYLLYEVWRFVAPALFRHERRLVLPFLFAGSFAFLVGCTFSYTVVIPYAYDFLIHFGAPHEKAMITLAEYFSLTLQLIFAIGLIFELPVVLMVLSRFGIVSTELLTKFRRQAVVASAVLAAVITPTPDAFTMMLVMVPLYLLYEIGILGVRWVGKPRTF